MEPGACLTLWPEFKGRNAESFLAQDGSRDCSRVKGGSSIGRVAVSKTVGWGFESLPPCHSKKWRIEREGPEGWQSGRLRRS